MYFLYFKQPFYNKEEEFDTENLHLSRDGFSVIIHSSLLASVVHSQSDTRLAGSFPGEV